MKERKKERKKERGNNDKNKIKKIKEKTYTHGSSILSLTTPFAPTSPLPYKTIFSMTNLCSNSQNAFQPNQKFVIPEPADDSLHGVHRQRSTHCR